MVLTMLQSLIDIMLMPINNIILAPIWYTLKIIQNLVYIPLYPVIYLLDIDTVNYYQLIEFGNKLMQYIMVSIIMGSIIGWLLSRQLILLSHFRFNHQELVPMMPKKLDDVHVNSINRLKTMKSTNSDSDQDKIVTKYHRADVTVDNIDPGSPVKIKLEGGHQNIKDEHGYDDDSVVNYKNDTKQSDNSLFDKYLEDTKLTSILEDYEKTEYDDDI